MKRFLPLGMMILLFILTMQEIKAQVVVRDSVKISRIPPTSMRPKPEKQQAGATVVMQNGVVSGFVMPKRGLLQVYYSFAERLDWYLPPWASLITIFNGDSAVADSILPRFPDVTISSFTFFNGCFATFEQHDRIFFQNFSAPEEVYLYNVGQVEQGDTVQFFYNTEMVYAGTRDTLDIFSADEVTDANGNLVGWNVIFGDYDYCLDTWKDHLEVFIGVLEVSVEILNAALAVTDHVQVARWDNAYDASSNVLNGATTMDNFIDLDPERFFVRITDPAKNTNPNAVDKTTAKIGTLFAGGGDDDDDLTEIELFETGNNTGVFQSKSQLLVTPDLTNVADPYQLDDLFLAHDGISGTVFDDTKSDRTHQTTRDGSVKAEYELPNGSKLSATVNVCQRNPDERRRLEIRVRVFNEPFRDTGYDHDNNASTPLIGAGNGVFDYNDLNGNGIHDNGEPSELYRDISSGATVFRRGNHPRTANGHGGVVTDAYVQDQIVRANIAWEQACIQVVQIGAIMFVDAPKDAGGRDILDDGVFNLHGDTEIVYNTYQAGMTIDLLEVFFVGPFARFNNLGGIAYSPFHSPFDHDEHSFTFLRSIFPIHFRALAHEIGHILSNQPDIPNNDQWIFFPQRPVRPDDQVNASRRITLATADACRTVRPAGNLTATGNRMLKTP